MIIYYPVFSIDWYIMIPIFWFLIYIYKYKKYRYNNPLWNYVVFIRMIFWGIAGCIITFCLFFYTLYPIYCFNTGNYEITEGYVKNFQPGLSTGHNMESFYVNGINFAYSDGVISSGYNKTIHHGGVIKGNGQHLKIAYIKYEKLNRIIYIEEFPFRDDAINSISIFKQFRGLITSILIILCGIIVLILFQIKKIKLDKNNSCISDIKVDKDNVIIQCIISFKNTYKTNKKVRIYGYFKKEKHNKLIKHIWLKGIDCKNFNECFDIPMGNSKFIVNFIDEAGESKPQKNDNFVIPKIRVIKVK